MQSWWSVTVWQTATLTERGQKGDIDRKGERHEPCERDCNCSKRSALNQTTLKAFCENVPVISENHVLQGCNGHSKQLELSAYNLELELGHPLPLELASWAGQSLFWVFGSGGRRVLATSTTFTSGKEYHKLESSVQSYFALNCQFLHKVFL